MRHGEIGIHGCGNLLANEDAYDEHGVDGTTKIYITSVGRKNLMLWGRRIVDCVVIKAHL